MLMKLDWTKTHFSYLPESKIKCKSNWLTDRKV